MNIEELKAKRDGLHDELHALLADYKPKEAEIRGQIKGIQEELYRLEMYPVYLKLKSQGNLSDAQQQKLALLEGKFGE